MMPTLLVPLDGHPLAECALSVAAVLARRLAARLLLVRAVQEAAAPRYDLAQLDAVQDAETYLTAVASRLPTRAVVETVVFYGAASAAILTEIELRHASMVVMATHARSSLGELSFGSVARTVLARSPVPVVLVPASFEGASTWLATPRPRILVPLDGSSYAEEALSLALGLVRRLDADLLLMQAVVLAPSPRHAEPRAAVAGAEDVDLLCDRARAYLEGVRRRMGPEIEGARVDLDVRAGPAEHAIVEAGRERAVAMVVMATHGETGVGRIVLGSVARGVLRNVSAPLALVRPTASRLGERRSRRAGGRPAGAWSEPQADLAKEYAAPPRFGP